MINMFDIREQDCRLIRVDFNGGIDLMIERPNGDVIHLVLTQKQIEALGVIR